MFKGVAAYVTVAVLIPILRGPWRARFDGACAIFELSSDHSTRSPAKILLSEVLSMVTIPPKERVKNSSVVGPMPSSAVRTLFDRHTPAAKQGEGKL